jgi:hypothetical protein
MQGLTGRSLLLTNPVMPCNSTCGPSLLESGRETRRELTSIPPRPKIQISVRFQRNFLWRDFILYLQHSDNHFSCLHWLRDLTEQQQGAKIERLRRIQILSLQQIRKCTQFSDLAAISSASKTSIIEKAPPQDVPLRLPLLI